MIGKLMNILPVSDLWQNATQVLKQLRKTRNQGVLPQNGEK